MPGLDRTVVDEVNWGEAIDNILSDVKSDFILAPHLDVVFRSSAGKLVDQLATKLKSGRYNPQLPVTFSVPKAGMLTRPGSILLPLDRLAYQGLVQHILPTIEESFDRERSFSHVPAEAANLLFKPSHESWRDYQTKVNQICAESRYVVRADIANYFETIPQHALINLLESSGCKHEVVKLLEELLLSFRERSSQGIIQGVYPSDVLGNFYLSDFDARCALENRPSARYVDDIFVGFDDRTSARQFLVKISEHLRKNGLAFNEQKTAISESEDVLYQEGDVDRMFDAAREEIHDAIGGLIKGGYGFQGDWINEDDLIGEDDFDLVAVRALLHYRPENSAQAEKIDRFCLPILRGAGDQAAVDHALAGLDERPHLTRLYFSYLNNFTSQNEDLRERIEHYIADDGFFVDYQRMYYMAGILNCDSVGEAAVRKAHEWLASRDVGPETRAIAAIFVAKFGTAPFRRSVRQQYERETEIVRAAILYAARYFPTAEKLSMRKAWGGHSELNSLISGSI